MEVKQGHEYLDTELLNIERSRLQTLDIKSFELRNPSYQVFELQNVNNRVDKKRKRQQKYYRKCVEEINEKRRKLYEQNRQVGEKRRKLCNRK